MLETGISLCGHLRALAPFEQRLVCGSLQLFWRSFFVPPLKTLLSLLAAYKRVPRADQFRKVVHFSMACISLLIQLYEYTYILYTTADAIISRLKMPSHYNCQELQMSSKACKTFLHLLKKFTLLSIEVLVVLQYE